MRTTIIASLAAAALIVAPAFPAAAQQGRDVVVQAHRPTDSYDVLQRTITVRLADLRTEAGQRKLYRRVASVAWDVCPDNISIPSLDGERHTCVQAAREGARPQIERAIARANALAANDVALTMTIGIAAR